MNRHPQTHMTEDEFINFVLEELPVDLEQVLDQHLADCVSCTQKLEDFYTAQEEFPEEEWARQRNAFVSNLRQQIFGPPEPPLPPPSPWRERLRDFLASFSYSGLTLEPAFAAREPEETESPDKVFGLFIEETPNQDVVVRFDATTPELAGTTIQLVAGPWQREMRFEKPLATGEVMAEVIISRAERAKLPEGTTLRAILDKVQEAVKVHD